MGNKRLDTLLTTEKPAAKIITSNKFNAKFNAKKEFPIWVREQFPDLKEYSARRKKYQELEKRREEVYEAAKLAWKYIEENDPGCVISHYYDIWKSFDKSFHKKNLLNFTEYLEKFVDAIKRE